uniref:Peroxisomal 2,4-dienoyl-CoA reductase [(3E)-enoyl-CoA-producing] n=1 Tax=Taeniopygia guttata TaxID=59729 RepID=A0A674GCL9_TAEGU
MPRLIITHIKHSELVIHPVRLKTLFHGQRSQPVSLGALSRGVPDPCQDPRAARAARGKLCIPTWALPAQHPVWLGYAVQELSLATPGLAGCSQALSSLSWFFQASKKLVAATGQQCLPVSMDVRQPQSIAAAVDEALQEFKRIDILINGAAGNFLCPASALSFNAFKTVIDIDTMGTFNTSKVLFEKYFRDHGGIIVNITATLSYRGQALQVHAGAAKAAIEAMTRHLAVEWGPNKIRVNSLAPGPISGTEGFRRLGGKFAEQSKQFSAIPLQRAGNKTEIAHSALFLASPLSSYVTGTTLVVDGGSWLTSPNSFSALLGIASSSSAKL